MDCKDNWQEFGKTPFNELSDSDRYSSKAYAWFYDRLPSSVKSQAEAPVENVTPVGPPARFFPFPFAVDTGTGKDVDRSNGLEAFKEMGGIGFLSVDRKGTPNGDNPSAENDTVKQHVHKAATVVFKLFSQLDDQVGSPNVDVQARPVDGGSLALSAMIATACQLLRILTPDDVIATGCLEEEKLIPVSKDTLLQKICASARFGYRHFIVVEGQKGRLAGKDIPACEMLPKMREAGILPPDTELEIIEVSTEPMRAILQILQTFPGKGKREIATLLAAFGKKYVRSCVSEQSDFVVEALLPFCKSEENSDLVRHVALDLLCRRELHRGDTQKAEQYRVQIPILRMKDFPSGRLGAYLKFEESASRAVLDLDLGFWKSEHPDHQLADRKLERLKGCIQDNCVEIEEVRVAMALANTKARRLFFSGRLNEDVNLIRQAWDELTAFHEYWNDIFEYTRKNNLTDETFDRQRNQCCECMADYWHLTGTVLECEALPKDFQISVKYNAFDLVAWLQWQVMHSSGEIDLGTFLKQADALYTEKKWYPFFLPYEKILLYSLGTEEEQAHAREQLTRANFSSPDGILALLAMRHAFWVGETERMQEICRKIPENSSLRLIADRLLEKPETIGFRCPY